MLTKSKKKQLYAALDAIALRKARIADDNEIIRRIKERKALIKFRLNSGAYVMFNDIAEEQQTNIMRAYFHIYKWSYPNGSSGRDIDYVRHKNVMHTHYGTCVYCETTDQCVLINTDKCKVNTTVDFGVHFYSGDVEMIDIKMSRMEKL